MSSPSEAPRRRFTLIGLLVLVGLPLFLRLAAIDHGAPRNYLPDTHVVRNALGMLKDEHLVPPVSKYSSYPNLIPYMLIPIYGTQYAVGRATGKWGGAEEFGNHVKQYPHTVHLPARILVAVLGSLTPLLVFLTMRAAGLRSGAWLAAWLTATSVLAVHFSVQERPWAPMVFFQAAALYPAVLHARDGRTKHLIWCGVFAAMSFSCHQAGIGTLALCGFAWFFGAGEWRGPALRRRLILGALCVATFVVVSLVVGHPYYLVHGSTPTDALSGEEIVLKGEDAGLSFGGQAQPLGFRLASIGTMSTALLGHDLVLFVLFLPGLWRAFRFKELRPALAFAVLWAVVFMTNKNDFVRYLMPICVLFAIPGGVLLQDLWESKSTRWLVAVALTFTLVMASRLVFVMSQPDTREDAERRVRELPAGSLVALDRYGPVPPLDQASLALLKKLRETDVVILNADGEEVGRKNESLRQREEFRLDAYEAGYGEVLEPGLPAVMIEDVLDFWDEISVRRFDPPLGEDPLEVLRSLGVTHVLAVDRSPNVLHRKELPLTDLFEGVEPLWILDPSASETLADEAFLPADMSFPLTALWSVDRPGPWMALYPLN